MLARITPYLILFFLSFYASAGVRATGDLGIVIERAQGSVLIVSTTQRKILSRINDLGDLSHASVVFSRNQRYAYVFGRDGGLSKIDLLQDKLVKRIVQAKNSIGGAISQDGKLIAVSNYSPGGVKIFSSDTLELLADIPALDEQGKPSRVVGLVDIPGQGFAFSLFDAGEIWLTNVQDVTHPVISRYLNIGRQPYDALLSTQGRYYIAGLFGEKGLAMLDLWRPEQGVRRLLPEYGKDDEKRPVYKMPHLEGWADTGRLLFVPAIGRHEVLVIDKDNWRRVKTIPVLGQPVFVMARPDGRQIWVNFAFPDNQYIQVIDVKNFSVVKQLQPGKAVLHMEFTPRGDEVWVSVRDENQVIVYDTASFSERARIEANKPSGIFFTSRAYRLGL
jgi:protein NirF